MKTRLILLGALLFTKLLSFGQSKLPLAIPSPNAASLGIFGQIPVNYFNGLPSIDIPLYTINESGVSIPIALSYHASGVRPDHHPGWVGLGWTLSAGGAITRIVNGEPDEMKVPSSISSNPDEKSYLINYGALNRSDWDQASALNPILQHSITVNYPVSPTPSPDEFMFNFNGYSGSFFLDHTGTWKVRSSNGKDIKIALTTNSFELTTSPGNPSITLARIIDKIVLKTPDGMEYTFGGTNASIEFSRNAGERDETYRQVVPSSWFLTNIKAMNGQHIVFNYERGGYAIIASESWQNSYINTGSGSAEGVYGAGEYTAETLINPVYLKEILTENQIVAFTRSESNELKSPDNWKAFYDEGNPQSHYKDIGTEGSKWYKLDGITITDHANNVDVKKIDFTYKNLPTSRLMLLSVQEKDPNNQLIKNPYQFTYFDNPNFDLPPYISRKLDHWGFFNNVNFFTTKPGGYQYTPNDEAAYKASREANATYLLEGTLSNISYPTGGETEFVYEPNKYSYIAHSYDSNPYFQVEQIGANGYQKIAGGLRIKKIISKSNSGPDQVKEFFYLKTDGSGFSSGILGGEQHYVEQYYLAPLNCSDPLKLLCVGGTPKYWIFSNHSIMPLSYTQGNHITYSEVTEKNSDGGYKVYKYSNHDNPLYRNTSAIIGGYYNIASRYNVPFTDMSYSRGKLLVEETYNAANKLNQRITREYNLDPNRFEDAIRVGDINITTFQGYLWGASIIAYKKYLFEPYLSKVTVDDYNQNNNDYSRKVSEYAYDNQTNQLKIEKVLQSNGDQLKTLFRYPKDKLDLSSSFSSTDLNIVDEMVQKNVTANLLEKEIYKNSTFLSRESTIYNKYIFGTNNMYLPGLSKSRFGNAIVDNIDVQFDGYDQHGNLLGYSKPNSTKTVYLWGYNGQYPVAKIEGSNYTTVSSYINQSTLNNSSITDNDMRTALGALRTNLQNALITTYTYKPLIGMTSMTDVKNMTAYYEYDSFQRLKYIRDQDQNMIKSFCYSYAGQTMDCNGNYFNTARTHPIRKNDCYVGGIGGLVNYTVPARKYKSTISQAAADQLALSEIAANGQNYANSNGTCTTVYARIEQLETYVSQDKWPYFWEEGATYDSYVRLYEDQNCTIPLTFPEDLWFDVEVKTRRYADGMQEDNTTIQPFKILANTSEVFMGRYFSYNRYDYYFMYDWEFTESYWEEYTLYQHPNRLPYNIRPSYIY